MCNERGLQLSFFEADENIVIPIFQELKLQNSQSVLQKPSPTKIIFHSHSIRAHRIPSEEGIDRLKKNLINIHLCSGDFDMKCGDSYDFALKSCEKDKSILLSTKKKQRSCAQLTDKSHAKETTTSVTHENADDLYWSRLRPTKKSTQKANA